MCPCCVSCTKKAETKLPENELWQLYRAAYEQYKSEILNGEKAYSRYVNDFFHYHLPVKRMSEPDVKLHVMHVFSIKELLEDRRDLVDAFFKKESFEEKEFLQMDYLFNSGHSLVLEHENLANFSQEQVLMITQFANTVKLFRSKVSVEEITSLFACTLDRPLQAESNRYVALFFATLRDHGLLPYSWQMIIENNKLLASSSTNKPLRASQLSNNLTQARNAKLILKEKSNQKDPDVGFGSTCKEFVKKLKESL